MSLVTIDFDGTKEPWKPWYTSIGIQAASWMETIVFSTERNNFLEQVLSKTYTYSGYAHYEGNRRMTSTISNSKIVDIIKGGIETYTQADQVINLKVALETYGNKYKMGYVNTPKPLITTNKKWLDNGRVDSTGGGKNDPLSVAAHWMHEWLHVAGMRHESETKVDYDDAVYQIGYLITEIGESLGQDVQLKSGMASDFKSDIPFSDWGKAYREAVEAGAAANEHACGYTEFNNQF